MKTHNPSEFHEYSNYADNVIILKHMGVYTVGKISYKIDKEQLVVSELFSLLDSVKMQLGISDWGIKRTTLEDGNH